MTKARKRRGEKESKSMQQSVRKRRGSANKNMQQSVRKSRSAAGKSKRHSVRTRQKARPELHELQPNETLQESTSEQVEAFPRRLLPKEHWESTYIDGRVYIPTLDDFNADAIKKGSMLDEVSFLPVEDLASLLCGSRIFVMIRNSVVGMNMLELCRDFKEKHCKLDLRAVANEFLVRKHLARLLLSEDCNEEFFTPTGICFYFEHILRALFFESQWKLRQRRSFCTHLSQVLANAKTGMALVDDSFYKVNLCHLNSIEPYAIQQATGLPSEEVTKMLECLFANAMRFFVLYCVHALRDQVVTRLSNAGEPFFRLKNVGATQGPVLSMRVDLVVPKFRFCVSNEDMSSCIPLSEVHVPTFDDLEDGNDCASLLYQIAHLPVPQITRLLIGERLFARLEVDFPVFIAQMHEYAALLKFAQSRTRYGHYLYTLRTLREKEFLVMRMMKTYVKKVLCVLCDWVPLGKKEKLIGIIGRCIHRWTKYGQLFNASAYDSDYEEYYVLRRFSEHRGCLHSLPPTLLKEISRRFDHFFIVYVTHALREHATAHEKAGRVRFRFKQDFSDDPFRTDVIAPLDPQSVESAPVGCSALQQSSENVSTTTMSCETAHQSKAVSNNTPSATVPSVSEGKAASTTEAVDVARKDVANDEGHTDEEWEMKLFERVKQDLSVPPYFKTTFGILVANNHNLRDEKSFLHSQLGL